MPEPEDPIAEARRLLAERTPGEWVYVPSTFAANIGGIQADQEDTAETVVINLIGLGNAALIAAAPRLLAALCDRLEAAEREFRQSHEANCVPDYTERGLHSSWCRLYMVGTE